MIEFVCDADSTFGHPVLTEVDNDLCLVQFEWKTVSACVPDVIIPDGEDDTEFQDTCIHTSLDSDFTVDLTSLYQSTGPWYVTDLDKKFPHLLVLNVCSPIRAFGPTSHCPFDSSVCAIEDANRATSYGRYSTVNLTQTFGRPVALLEFSDGDNCSTNPALKYRTKVHMVCVPGGAGNSPKFITFDEKECVVHLEWHTAAACPQGKHSRFPNRTRHNNRLF